MPKPNDLVLIERGGKGYRLPADEYLHSVADIATIPKNSIGCLNANPTFGLGEVDYKGFITGYSYRTIVNDVVNNTAGSLKIVSDAQYGGSYISDTFYPVEADREYRAVVKIGSVISGANVDPTKVYKQYTYLGVICYDSDKKIIRPENLTDIAGWDATLKRGKSSTELINPVNNGDTSIVVADASKWSPDTAGHKQSLLLHPLRPDGSYGYIGANGRYYDEHKYSAINMYYGIDHNNITDNGNGTWTVGLQSAWTLGSFPAGTHIQNSYGGGTYNYWVSSYATALEQGKPTPTIWNRYASPWRGWDENTAPYNDPGQYAGNFRNGTAFVTVLGLLNYNLYEYDTNGNYLATLGHNAQGYVRTSWYSKLSLEWRHKV